MKSIDVSFFLVILLALMLSAFSLFKVTHNEHLADYHLKHRIKGADILCDQRQGSHLATCKGDYFRGWPFKVGKGQIVGRDDGQFDEHFEIDYEFAIYNTLVWILPATIIITPITILLARKEL